MIFVILFVLCVGASGDPNQECGRIISHGETLLLRGLASMRGDVPWQAGIYQKSTTPYKLYGGGTLISNTIVITAAHFFWTDVDGMLPASQFAVAVGKIHRPWDDAGDEEAQKSDAKEIHIPSRYRGAVTNFQDDIAVVITTPFVYNSYIRPACISFDDSFEKEQLKNGAVGKVAGWGLTFESDKPSPLLKVIDMPYVDINKCISESPANVHEYLTSDKICAGVLHCTYSSIFQCEYVAIAEAATAIYRREIDDYNIRILSDSAATLRALESLSSNLICRGDSGGGLTFPTEDRGAQRYYLRGISSVSLSANHDACNDGYTAFTQISKHESFIKQFWTESH